ncbi:MAG: cation transporter [Acidobacteria bacterium]|nr:MAG: cation transporter [Acidobacteriota bacterium]
MQREAEPGTAVTHDHGLGQTPEGRIRAALILTLLTMGASIAGGIFAHSLALLSDAGHMLADAGALALALVAQRVASRPRTHRRTYGSRRAETLAAFTNAIFLGVVSVWVIAEALERWREPPDIKGGWMLAVAAGGLVVNLVAARLLARGGVHNENTRAALAHVLSDAAGSVAAMIAAVLVLGWGWRRADPLISVGLAVLIFWSAWRLVTRTLDVLMEGTPAGLVAGELESTIRETPGVAALHDLHAWTISEGFEAVTVHVVLDGTRHGTEVARDVSDRIHDRHGIEHVTVQPEAAPAPVSFQPLAGLKGKRR